MRNRLHIVICCGLLACASGPSPTSILPGLGQFPSLSRDSRPISNGGDLRSAALDYYAKGDYVRALRFGYWATQTMPTDVRLRLLLGIVYDGGFNRPDLALPEYERALSLKPSRQFQDKLRRRIRYLSRRLLQESTRTSLIDKSGNPFSENWLAIYPLRIVGPRSPEIGLEYSLLDWILPDLKTRSPGLHVDPFTSLIVAQVFREVADQADAQTFARWSGAGLTLTGQLTDIGNQQLRVVIELLDAMGAVSYTSRPVVIKTTDPGAAYENILSLVDAGLGLMSAEKGRSRPPITNAGSMALYSEALGQYLVGQVSVAEKNLEDAMTLDPDSDYLMSRHTWARSERLGRSEGAEILDDYHRLLRLPDPNQLVRDRLMRGHSLSSPAVAGTSGLESEDPYKAPQTGLDTP
jgi:tetratricopeptide (TPR) repeat protein